MSTNRTRVWVLTCQLNDMDNQIAWIEVHLSLFQAEARQDAYKETNATLTVTEVMIS